MLEKIAPIRIERNFMAKKKHKFVKYTHSKIIFKNIIAAKDNEERFNIWRMVMGNKQVFPIQLAVIKKYENRLIFKVEPNLRDKVQEFIIAEERLNFFIPDRGVLFQCKCLSYEGGQLIVEAPEVMAQLDRRKRLRLSTNDLKNTEIEIVKEGKNEYSPTMRLKKYCFDIGSGGLSVVTNKHESKIFRKGEEFKNMSLWLESDGPFKFSAKIIRKIPVEPDPENNLYYKGHRICFEFTEITEELQYLINYYVFNHLNLADDFDIPFAA